MHHQQWTLHVEPSAPAKPAWGAPCNGCGVCCLVAPCPLGVLVSRRRQGACDAVLWVPEVSAYRCGLMAGSQDVVRRALPVMAHRLVPWLTRLLQRLAPRWIAAGQGCDCSLQAETVTIRPAVTPAGPASALRPTTPDEP
jgi:hypothetical protein